MEPTLRKFEVSSQIVFSTIVHQLALAVAFLCLDCAAIIVDLSIGAL